MKDSMTSKLRIQSFVCRTVCGTVYTLDKILVTKVVTEELIISRVRGAEGTEGTNIPAASDFLVVCFQHCPRGLNL